jgi:maltose alpha-D-glucosyltransferase / alpha-amylase
VTAVDRGVVPDLATDDLDQWRRTWVSTMQQRLLDDYLLEITSSGLVPHDRADVQLLLDLFVLEKAFYEIRYELANRPEWVSWPLAAAAELMMPVRKTGR